MNINHSLSASMFVHVEICTW